jgi:hypothetical protein
VDRAQLINDLLEQANCQQLALHETMSLLDQLFRAKALEELVVDYLLDLPEEEPSPLIRVESVSMH